jgi:hypothetical protein
MSGPYTYNKVHVAAKGQTSEADFHMQMDRPTKGLPVNPRLIEIASVDDIEAMLSKFIREHYEIDYLDFHAHGHAGTIYVDNVSKFTVKDLKRFRNRGFDRVFRPNAIISFMSCSVAQVDPGDGEDGELFLAEMASAFLGYRGGTVLGRNKDWKYKPPMGLGFFPPVGPFTATFKNEGAEIAAEISARSSEPSLRGQFRLDKQRIAQEIAVITAIVNWAISLLERQDSQPKKTFAPPPMTGGPLDDMVARYLNNERNLQALNNHEQLQKNLVILKHSLDSLKKAENQLSGLGQLYVRLHSATSIIDAQLDVLATLGLPLINMLPPILTSIRSMPVKP